MTIKRQLIYYAVARDNAPDMLVFFPGRVLTVFDSILCRVRRSDGVRFSRVATVDVEDPGYCSITWVDGDLVTGDHAMEFEFIDGTDKFTLPKISHVILRVREDLG